MDYLEQKTVLMSLKKFLICSFCIEIMNEISHRWLAAFIRQC